MTTSAPDSLRARKKREKLDRILKAARTLFAERGFEGTTTRAISELAGIGTGTLFSYFPDKTALLAELFASEILAAADDAFETLPASGPLVDQLMHLFGRLYDYYLTDPRLSRALLKEILFIQAQERRLGATLGFITRLAQLVDAAKVRGEVAPDAPSVLVATGCFGQYFLVLTTLLSPGFTNPTAGLLMLRQLLTLVIPKGATP